MDPTDSDPHAAGVGHLFDLLLLQDADLVVVEFAINDEASKEVGSSPPASRRRCKYRAFHCAPVPRYVHSQPALTFQPILPGFLRFAAAPHLRAMLRRMLQRPSQPTLLLLQYYPWMRSFGDGVTQGLYYREPETEMTVIGQVSS